MPANGSGLVLFWLNSNSPYPPKYFDWKKFGQYFDFISIGCDLLIINHCTGPV